ncbi:MAG: ATP-binding protein [Acidobacteriota bacterium]
MQHERVTALLTEVADVRLRDPEEGLRMVEAAREDCALIQDPDLAEALSLRLDATQAACLMRTDLAESARVAEAVLQAAGSSPRHVHARVAALAVKGALLTRSDVDEAASVLEEGLTLHEEAELDDARLKATLLYAHGNAAYRKGDFRQARLRYGDGVRVAPEESQIALFTLGMLGGISAMLGDHEGAGHAYSKALAGHRRAGSAIGMASALHNLSENLRRLGRLADAEKANTECLALLEGDETGTALNDPGQHLLALTQRANILLDLERPGPALENAVRGDALAQERPDQHLRVVCRVSLATCRLASGDAAGGLRDAESGLEAAQRTGGKPELNMAHLTMAKVLQALGRDDECAEHVAASLEHARAIGSPAHVTDTLEAAALLYERCGLPEKALHCMREFHDSHAATMKEAAESRLERLLLERELELAQERQAELQDAGRQLEEAVQQRTAELELANRQLRRQVEAIHALEEERSAVEEHLHQAQKLEAVGGLAAGVAHDLNNVLTVILGHGSLLSDETSGPEPEVTAMVEAAQRASDMTRQLLLFSRQHPSDPRVLDLQELLADLQPMLRRLVPASVVLDYELDPKPLRVEADAIQLEQVLLNLVANARDAVGDSGRILVQTLRAPDEATACIRVSDDGSGIDPEIQPKVLDPFFTTKAPGKGTGLGLSTAYGIVRRHGGELHLTSTPGKGTQASVSLPRTDASPTRQAAWPAAAELDKPPVTLLVEDDDDVRNVVGRMLENCGAKVLQATNGRVALEILAERQHGIDLVVTDIVMPMMGGLELLEEARNRWPHLKCLLVSGYSPEPGRVPGDCEFMAKPITTPKLQRALSTLLSNAS